MDNTLTQIVSYYINKESKISHEISIEEILEIIKSGKEVKVKLTGHVKMFQEERF